MASEVPREGGRYFTLLSKNKNLKTSIFPVFLKPLDQAAFATAVTVDFLGSPSLSTSFIQRLNTAKTYNGYRLLEHASVAAAVTLIKSDTAGTRELERKDGRQVKAYVSKTVKLSGLRSHLQNFLVARINTDLCSATEFFLS